MKLPKLTIKDGKDAREKRRALGCNQSEFWSTISVTQSGGSRYEKGRALPEILQLLLNITYGTKQEASQIVEHLRSRASVASDEGQIRRLMKTKRLLPASSE